MLSTKKECKKGGLHPTDLKPAPSKALDRILQKPFRYEFKCEGLGRGAVVD
ncbi:hypothetical protein Tco_1334155, partial [Tanacetum coccineum]